MSANVVDKLHVTPFLQIGDSGVNVKGTPEEVAERLIKEEGGDELKRRELERKGAEAVPGVAGSGLERGEPAAIAQVSDCLECRISCACDICKLKLCCRKCLRPSNDKERSWDVQPPFLLSPRIPLSTLHRAAKQLKHVFTCAVCSG